ncbi:integrator complex subunit 3 [Copidosoma floridanum]|uniref:integrator complex subunit 3 n=1 Tax=Copidosoma floridanum TaxID=29053 RepID=UPI0006C97DB0|nr:integrator complex subunit 3 [Copidosoma floridanum]XP_014216662.1 integrator complex subunit 3 [Copidosoma floridanum]
MDQNKPQTIRIFLKTCIENKDELEEKFDRCYNVLQNLCIGLSEKDIHDNLNNAVCKDKTHEEVCLGLLTSILTNPQDAVKNYRDLTLVSRDGLAVVLNHLNQMVIEKYLRLSEIVRGQLFWILREMIRTNISNTDNICLSLLRYAAGGDTSQRNLFLIDAILNIFQENRLWLDKFPFLIASTVYTYLRLIEDHSAAQLASLRQKEVTFTVSLLREKITECLVIGRDLVRLLQNVARIPEFEQLWKDILLYPKSLSPNFSGILQVLQMRTSRRFLQLRLTPDMERKLVFLTSQVRFGNHKRYQEWFQRQYLATPESQTLRCDLIRFIVGVIHPTNELLCSDIIPRWAVIGWLFTTCTLPVAASNAKLALFYDWLFFEPDKDNIMNIEPAILVMQNSMRSHPAVTATLLDFLCRIIPNFYPSLEEKVKNGIFSSLRQILEKRVLPSLCPLFDSPKLDRELRTKIRETFKEFCFSSYNETGKIDELNKEISSEHIFESAVNVDENNHTGLTVEPSFSDEEEDVTLRAIEKKEASLDSLELRKSTLKHVNYINRDDIVTIGINLEPDKLKSVVENLIVESDNEIRCQLMEKIVQMIVEDEIDTEIIPLAASYLSNALSVQIDEEIFPGESQNDEFYMDSISTPLFVMFRNQFQLCKEDDGRKKLLSRFLVELLLIKSKIGYLLLYFLKVWSKEEEKRESEPSNSLNELKALVYKDFCSQRDEKFDVCLLLDLKQCHEDNISMFYFLLPDIFTEFQNVAQGNMQLLYLIVSTIDSIQLQSLVCQIMQGYFQILKKESFTSTVTSSLKWETFDQYCFWQLVYAHDFPIDVILLVLPKLQFRHHAEALTSILLMLKKEKPNQEILKQLLSRQHIENDMFVVAVLKYWCREYEEKLSELLSSLLCTRYPPCSPNKRKRSAVKQNQSNLPSGEQLLGHLDLLRQSCTTIPELQLYQSESMQKALSHVQTVCNDSIRKCYGDLFALTEVNEDHDFSTSVAISTRKNTHIQPLLTHAKSNHRKNSARERSTLKRIMTKDKHTESSDQTSEMKSTICQAENIFLPTLPKSESNQV